MVAPLQGLPAARVRPSSKSPPPKPPARIATMVSASMAPTARVQPLGPHPFLQNPLLGRREERRLDRQEEEASGGPRETVPEQRDRQPDRNGGLEKEGAPDDPRLGKPVGQPSAERRQEDERQHQQDRQQAHRLPDHGRAGRSSPASPIRMSFAALSLKATWVCTMSSRTRPGLVRGLHIFENGREALLKGIPQRFGCRIDDGEGDEVHGGGQRQQCQLGDRPRIAGLLDAKCQGMAFLVDEEKFLATGTARAVGGIENGHSFRVSGQGGAPCVRRPSPGRRAFPGTQAFSNFPALRSASAECPAWITSRGQHIRMAEILEGVGGSRHADRKNRESYPFVRSGKRPPICIFLPGKGALMSKRMPQRMPPPGFK